MHLYTHKTPTTRSTYTPTHQPMHLCTCTPIKHPQPGAHIHLLTNLCTSTPIPHPSSRAHIYPLTCSPTDLCTATSIKHSSPRALDLCTCTPTYPHIHCTYGTCGVLHCLLFCDQTRPNLRISLVGYHCAIEFACGVLLFYCCKYPTTYGVRVHTHTPTHPHTHTNL